MALYPWLQQSIYEMDLRRRLRQNQVENTPGAMPSPNSPSPIPTSLFPAPKTPVGLFSAGITPKASAPPATVDQFQGRRLGGGSITETPLAPPLGTNPAPSGPPLSMPVVGERGIGGTRSAMYGAPSEPSQGQRFIRGAGNALSSLLGMAFSSPQQQLAMEKLNEVRDQRIRSEEAVKNWGTTLAQYKEAGVPSQVIDLAKAAGAYQGSQYLEQYVAGMLKGAGGEPDLINVADNESGDTFMTTKARAASMIETNPNRYALAGNLSAGGGGGNWINMVEVDGNGAAVGAPIQVLEGSPQHQRALGLRMVEAGPVSMNTRDPIRDRRVAEYQQLYGVNRATATKLADGLIKGFTDPLTGQTQFFDMVDLSRGGGGSQPAPQRVPVPGPMANNPAPPPVPGRSAMPGEARPVPAALRDPMTTPLLGLVDVFGGAEPLQEAAGKITMGSYDPGAGVNVPRNRFRILKQDIYEMYGGNRMSDQDRQRIEKAFPGEGVFESPSAAFDALSAWSTEAQNTIATQGAIANDPNRSAQLRREAEGKVVAAEKVLRTIGDPQQYSRPGSNAGAQLAKPISQMSLNELESLDERTLSNSQLLEAARRERELRGGK